MLSIELLHEIQKYIDENFVEESIEGFYDVDSSIRYCASSSACHVAEGLDDLREKLSNVDESFSQMLTKKIDAVGMTDADCYHKAQLNRSHFNKIKNDSNYHIQKETVFALALALSLNRVEADKFLAKAGYAFSPSSKTDLIIAYCINKRIFDVIEVNQILYTFDQKLLGAGIREKNVSAAET